ncbi:hypothetical protein GW813_00380 [bacterium]|nr:hypothetical protein [bacterium]
MSTPLSLILYRDRSWLVVDKPTGMATHAGNPGELGVVEWLDLHLGIKAHVVSRLDRATSGALLLAADPAASARAQDIHENAGALKTYTFVATCGGDAPAPGATWTRTDDIDGKTAHTEFRCLGHVDAPGLPLLVHGQAEITHGRRHQIRRHASLSGLPILGDDVYGGALWGRLCLHCHSVRWPEIPTPVTAPLPASLGALSAGDPNPGFALCRDRRGLWPAAVCDAFRAVHRDEINGLPASLDVYGPWFNLVWYDEDVPLPEALPILEPVLEAAGQAWGLRGGVLSDHRRNPHEQQLVGERIVRGERPPRTFVVQEHDLRYRINLLTTQHTGLFTDQRDVRRRVAQIAAGRRMANLFAYTCSFSVAAAAERAEVVFSVDTARPCLNTGKENFELNHLTQTGIGKFIQSDVRKWLARQVRKRDRDSDEWQGLDLIICDPPVFASARDGGSFAVEREWGPLARICAGLLAPGGVAVFANNHRTGDHVDYRKALEGEFAQVTHLRAPLDFPVLPGCPPHVRTFWCEKT